MQTRPSEVDVYRMLATIQSKIEALRGRGKFTNADAAFKDLVDYVNTECSAASLRAARSKADKAQRRQKPEEGTTYVS